MSVNQLLCRIEALKHDHVAVDNDVLYKCGLNAVTLRDYQLYAVGWIVGRFKAGHGCILADEMGLGKTCTSISSLLYLKEFCGLQTCLIICPLTIVNNWLDELDRFAPGLTVAKITGSQPDRKEAIEELSRTRPNVVLTTYEILLIEQEKLLDHQFDVCILDEAQRVKNQATIAHRLIASTRCPHKLLLTGTPVQNNMMELFSLLHLVAPSVFLDADMKGFVSRFSVVESSNFDLLSRILVEFLLRRTKVQVLPDLPAKTETIIYHGLSAIQKRLYRAILTKNAGAVIGEGTSSTQVCNLMNILMQLRKCILHPYFFPGIEPEPFENGEHLVTNSGKMLVLDALLRLLDQNGHKSLIFSKFTTMLDIVQDYMTMRHFTYERVDGNVRGDERHAAINAFNEDACTRFFLLSTLAGGVGLNLTSADTVVFLDIDFNPQNDLQALARCHRIGQTRNVKIFRLICKGTVEEVMLSRQRNKLLLASHVLQNNTLSGAIASATSPLSADELRKIIGFGAEKLFVDHDNTDDKVDVGHLMSKIDVGKDGQWPDESACLTEDIINDGEEVSDIYDFQGETYRSPKGKRTLQQLLDAHTTPKRLIKRFRRTTPPLAEEASASSEDKGSTNSAEGQSDIETEEYVNDVRYVRGDVASVLKTISQKRAVSVLCVDSSGTWPDNSRLFKSFADSCPSLPKDYADAASGGKLKMGVAYLVDVNGSNKVALLISVCQGGKNLIRARSFNSCMAHFSDQLRKETADFDVHFPRIGFGAKNLNWYALERIIKKHLCKLVNVQVYVHYLARGPPAIAQPQIKLHFGDIFVGRDLRILDGNDEIRRLAIAYGADSAEPLLLSDRDGEAADEQNGTGTTTVTKQWVLDSIARGQALPTGS